MKQKKHRCRWELILLVALFSLLSGCKKGDGDAEATGDPGPEEYQFGEETVVALGATVEEFPAEGSYEESLVTYTYRGLSDGKAACSGYIAALMAEEEPFVAVDEELYQTGTPSLTEEEGTVYMARACVNEDSEEDAESEDDAEESSEEDSESEDEVEENPEESSEVVPEETAEENRVCLVQLDWTADSCTVTLRYQEGIIQQRPVETDTSSGGGSSMTLATAIDYIKSFNPADIGLEGTSMEEYQIYALDGVILVDDTPCLHLKAYRSDNPQQTNQVAGNFLLTGDKQHLYSLDEVNGVVTTIF
jgi:hypothetical protein